MNQDERDHETTQLRNEKKDNRKKIEELTAELRAIINNPNTPGEVVDFARQELQKIALTRRQETIDPDAKLRKVGDEYVQG